MMRRPKIVFWDFAFLTLGAVIALAVLPLVATGIATLRAMYDESHPPVRMSLYSAEKAGDGLRMRFRVTRLQDCDFVRLTGYSGTSSQLEPATVLRREDGFTPLSYPVGTTMLSPPWLMSPVFGPHVVLFGYYDCDGRLVRPKVIDQEIAQ